LRDLLKLYISTGKIEAEQQLPVLSELAGQLKVNLETVRKAYKQLEQEGLVTIRRGQGTYATGHQGRSDRPPGPKLPVREHARNAVAELLASGLDVDGARQVLDEALRNATARSIIFTECNHPQIHDISEILRAHLGVHVEGVLLPDLRDAVNRRMARGNVVAVVTTGFHVNEVRRLLRDTHVRVDFLITNMSPETRRKLLEFAPTTRFGFVCRDEESIPFYRELLVAELNPRNLVCCSMEDTQRVQQAVDGADVVLISPPIRDDIHRFVRPGVPVFNILDRVDPLSLRAIKELVGPS
jgi:GntR family transcriptional regulator